MTACVVAVGHATVCGPEPVDADLVAVALDCVDDQLAVYDGRVRPVHDLWREVFTAVLDGGGAGVTLVVPSWWPRRRVEFVERVALETAATVHVVTRAAALGATRAAVVEVGPDAVVVTGFEDGRTVLPRNGSVVDAVLPLVSGAQAVAIDAPTDLVGVPTLVGELTRRLRRRSVAVSCPTDDDVRCLVERARAAPVRRGPRFDRGRAAAGVGALLATVALAGAAVGAAGREPAADTGPAGHVGQTWVVEGRVAFEVPADWVVERVLTGPGSARVQATSPAESSVALHVTQAVVAADETLQATAAALAAALDAQPGGVFTDFAPDGRVADRPAVTYRELRTAVTVEWAVVLDGGLRIAIGCQRRSGATEPVLPCAHAVRTAHAVI